MGKKISSRSMTLFYRIDFNRFEKKNQIRLEMTSRDNYDEI